MIRSILKQVISGAPGLESHFYSWSQVSLKIPALYGIVLKRKISQVFLLLRKILCAPMRTGYFEDEILTQNKWHNCYINHFYEVEVYTKCTRTI